MKSFSKSITQMIIFAIIISFIFFGLYSCTRPIGKVFSEIDRLPDIVPDYTDIAIPPNIAPLNFLIKENGAEFNIDIYTDNKKSDHILITAKNNRAAIPIKQWKRLLSENKNESLYIDITMKDQDNEWKKFRTIENKITNEEIDSHVAYRLINPGYVLWWEMGIYQRNIENFKESSIFTNRTTSHNCMNCHSFCNNNPDLMMFHMRGNYGGTMIIKDNNVRKMNTGTPYTMSAGVYPAWHPDGNHIAFSVNKIGQSFHAQKEKSIHVSDIVSDLVVYDILTNTITTSAKVSTKRMENLPDWTPDGNTLYFCSAPELTENTKYDEVKYDLMRIPYNTKTNEWGNIETVISAKEIGRSISFPKISPDGNYILFCTSDYGYFSIHFTSSDLYLLDLKTNQIQKLPINSSQSESYHSWSSNSRWFVFASKRKGGLCSRLYFSYIDSTGHVYKPFIMPQKDPTFYDTFVKNYNVPEMIHGPVTVNHWDLMQAAHMTTIQAQFDPTVDADALSGATRIIKPPVE